MGHWNEGIEKGKKRNEKEGRTRLGRTEVRRPGTYTFNVVGSTIKAYITKRIFMKIMKLIILQSYLFQICKRMIALKNFSNNIRPRVNTNMGTKNIINSKPF